MPACSGLNASASPPCRCSSSLHRAQPALSPMRITGAQAVDLRRQAQPRSVPATRHAVAPPQPPVAGRPGATASNPAGPARQPLRIGTGGQRCALLIHPARCAGCSGITSSAAGRAQPACSTASHCSPSSTARSTSGATSRAAPPRRSSGPAGPHGGPSPHRYPYSCGDPAGQARRRLPAASRQRPAPRRSPAGTACATGTGPTLIAIHHWPDGTASPPAPRLG